VELSPELQQILSQVKRKEIERGLGKNRKYVDGHVVAEGIRDLVKEFESAQFQRRPKKEKEDFIIRSLGWLTSNVHLQNDLRVVFEKRGWLSPVTTEPVVKGEVPDGGPAEPVTPEPSLPPPEPKSQYDTSIGPQLPDNHGVSQYPNPIGPQLPENHGVSQYPNPIGPEAPPEISPFLDQVTVLSTEDLARGLDGVDAKTLAIALLDLGNRTDITNHIVEALPPPFVAEVADYIRALPTASSEEITSAREAILTHMYSKVGGETVDTGQKIPLLNPIVPEGQYNAPIGPQLPENQGVSQYDNPIGPKVPEPSQEPKKGEASPEQKRETSDEKLRRLRREMIQEEREKYNRGEEERLKERERIIPEEDLTAEEKYRLRSGDLVVWIKDEKPFWDSGPKRIAEIYKQDGTVWARFDEIVVPETTHNTVRVGLLEKVVTASPAKDGVVEGAPIEPVAVDTEEPKPDEPITPEPEPKKAITIVPSPSPELVKAVLEDPAGFDIGKALDVPGFDLFLIEVEKQGRAVVMEDESSVRSLFEAFAYKDVVVEQVSHLYEGVISQDVGISLGGEGKQAVREYIEEQAYTNPEKIKSLSNKFPQFSETTQQIGVLEKEIAGLKATLTPEAREKARKELQTKVQEFSIALKTNNFWKGAGWLHSVFQVVSEESAEKTRIRNKLRSTSAASTGIESVLTFGFGLSTRELSMGLKLAEMQLSSLDEEFDKKIATVAELEAKGAEVKRYLESGRIDLLSSGELRGKLVGLARAKIREKITNVVGPNTVASPEEIDEAHSLFERAVSASFGGDPDDETGYVEGDNSSSTYAVLKEWFDTALDVSVERQVEMALKESTTLSSGRFSLLQKAFDKLTTKEKLGPRSRADIRKLIVKRLDGEMEGIAKQKFDESTDEGKALVREARQKVIHLKALAHKQKVLLTAKK
ncbi:MAG: hypothetical protein NUV54_02450, partial [Candidatus Taylorbacteria bacterium]|nr:hypothetical protein [Candidatus Taylorbacteria bacterium]